MKKTIATILSIASLFSASYANASEQRLSELESRIENLQQQLAAQESDGYSSALENSWTQHVSISGLIEVEAGYHRPYLGDSTSDLVLATAELGITADISDWVHGEVIFLYEEDGTDLEIDVAAIHISPPRAPWYLSGGQFYLPFGVFETHMVSSTLTSDMSETRDTAFLAGVAQSDFYASVFVFNGTNKEDGNDHINNWGVQFGLETEAADTIFLSELSYLNDIGDSDTLQNVLSSPNVNDYTAGWNWFAKVDTGPFSMIGEYTSALSEFESNVLMFNLNGAKPSAWNLELGYHFMINQRHATIALGYQGTDEALPLELPEERMLAALSVNVQDNTAVSLEWARDQDYEASEGGTGESADTVTLQLAAEF
ncbi:LbtU family siderophore porin [Photobacterium atrarenae]|uniref:LbtU family siderophore porin n=1 Tax=Photobacterium atrarenae TaxID=865757 RepID=A0ABY5GMP7_9GAMM|nr:LbtU family siderophore porin [Photobacterium atrarenae]UTV29979.1 LbtU family siderophore porin [Photobacterium atrarenae]